MTARILNELKRRVSALTLVPSDGGRFEIEVDGELIYSKLATGAFPSEQEIVDALRSR